MENIQQAQLEKISIISPTLSGGGAEKVAVNLANYYASVGHEVDLVVFMKRGPYLAFVSDAVNLIDLQVSRTRYVFFKLHKYLKTNRQSLIISVIRDANIFVGLASIGLKIKSLTYREANTLDAIFLKPALSKKLWVVSRICGDIQVPATCQVHDIRRFLGILGFENRRLFS